MNNAWYFMPKSSDTGHSKTLEIQYRLSLCTSWQGNYEKKQKQIYKANLVLTTKYLVFLKIQQQNWPVIERMHGPSHKRAMSPLPHPSLIKWEWGLWRSHYIRLENLIVLELVLGQKRNFLLLPPVPSVSHPFPYLPYIKLLLLFLFNLEG